MNTMEVKLVKFGNTLVFRDRGREAFRTFEPNLQDVSDTENISLDFAGVLTFSPSWGDEFISPLYERYKNRLVFKNTSNSSVQATLKILKESKKIDLNVQG